MCQVAPESNIQQSWSCFSPLELIITSLYKTYASFKVLATQPREVYALEFFPLPFLRQQSFFKCFLMPQL